MSDRILPDSRLKEPKGIVRGVVDFLIGGKPTPIALNWEPIFCANCGKGGGFVPTENMTFTHYLCDPCAEKIAPFHDEFRVPDEVFFEQVKQEQVEKYGRELPGPEIAELLKDDRHTLSRLAKDRKWRGA